MTVKDLREWLEGKDDNAVLTIEVQDPDTYETILANRVMSISRATGSVTFWTKDNRNDS